MTKWEYCIIEVTPNNDLTNSYFNELGEDGWECYSVDDAWGFFRRPKKSVPVRIGPTEHKTPSEGPSV